MSEFGIYFGTEVINVTEVEKKKPLLDVFIPQTRIINSVSIPKDSDEAKMANTLKEEFAKNKISPNDINVTLAGEDLIIRTFDLPIFLSKRELGHRAIAFEAKKYIPFKVDELTFDFQLYPDRKDKKILVLFVGIKRGILNKYLSIFEQLQIKIKSIEYAGFSTLRFLRLGGLKDKGILVFINVDLKEGSNFLVCQNGFPLFSRDITLIPISEAELESNLMERLTNEIRISLDFFRRKFPTKTLDKVIISSSPQLQTAIAALIKDSDLQAVSLETAKFLSKDFGFSTALAKSYAVAISTTQRLRFPINLLKPLVEKEEEPSTTALPIKITEIKINYRVAVFASLIILSSLVWGWLKRAPIENELRIIRANQPKIEGISNQLDLPALADLEKKYINNRNIMEGVVKDRLYLSEIMDIVPRLIPQGAWLASFSFRATENRLALDLQGVVSLTDPDKEFAAVNDIVLGFKNNPRFSRYFKEIAVVSMERTKLSRLKSEATKFEIICR